MDLSYIIGIDENDNEYKIPTQVESDGDKFFVRVKKEDFKGASLVKILPQLAECPSCDGYYVIPDQLSGITVDLGEEQLEHDSECLQSVCFYGIVSSEKCYMVIIEGMKYDACMRWSRKDGINSAYFAIKMAFHGIAAYEDITLTIYKLPINSTYNDMAKIYRDYKYENGLKTLRQKNLPMVNYAAEAPEIRIRMAWKPAPPQIEYQTEENEPEMHVAVTFDMVIQLMEDMKKAGIEKAQLCLVGWNKSGHDGRWPDIFPVEEKLGGEEGLRKAIKRAKELGYNIVGHTNFSDAYTIAKSFDVEKMVRDKDYNVSVGTPWSGGKMHRLCAKEAIKIFEKEIPKVRELGFEGVHYIDVLSVVPPYYCHHKDHPATRKDTALLWKEMLKKSREIFGGCASEGSYDITSEVLDFALYSGFVKFTKPRHQYKHNIIPLWELVYHGAVMVCPSSDLVNVGILDKKLQLKFIEFGGRPAMYIHSRFVTESKDRGNWMGEDDLRLNSKEEINRTVNALKTTQDFYAPLKHLQFERMLSHEYLTETLAKTTYENGQSVYINYGDDAVTVENKVIEPLSYAII
jgi:hypothetical protein